jgi:enoyl-CoA hydratase
MENLLYEKQDKVGILKINRPHAMNALNAEVLNELLKFLHHLGSQREISVLIFTGVGERAFIAGADIKEMQNMDHLQMLQFCTLGQCVSHALESAPFVTLAAVFGYALGGGLEMALACDFIYAGQSAKLGLPEINLGIIPGFGGTKRLSEAVGPRRAKEMILTGKTLTATEAFELGLVNRICSDGELLKDCLDIAQTIAKYSPHVISQAKRAVNLGHYLPVHEALELERNICAVCFAAPERAHAMTAFFNRPKKS